MAVVRTVLFYPYSGWRDRPWHESPAVDLLARSGRRVSEVYSREVTALGLQGPSSEARVFLSPAAADSDEGVVQVTVHQDFGGTFEAVHAEIPPGVADLHDAQRAALAFRILRAAVETLAPERGWSAEALGRAATAAQEAAPAWVFAWQSPWKSAPSRRWEARGAFHLVDPDAFGQAWIEARPRGEEDADPVRSDVAPSFVSHEGFKRSARTLSWDGPVATMTSFGHMGLTEPTEVRLDPTSPGPRAAAPNPVTVDESAVPPVVVTVKGSVPEEPTIRFTGGGPMNGVAGAYSTPLFAYLNSLEEQGRNWWAGADRLLLQIDVYFTDERPGISVRRLAHMMTATVRRAAPTTRGVDGEALARADVEALVAKVADRMGLPPLSLDLPDVQESQRPDGW
ncbi:hypothetical protein [Nocardioides bruguierae]|uniref:hypothetical protein n=1 Tax=Nocardioides bruguierae TaxID=2945102 RepID=UPI002020A045|nr:hypothetical protein [Nocardioides bruguierae]MCL8026451.1 hypothetical protein [Nocardioides bruguierae]